MSPVDPGSHSFLGEEFLTWLWFRLDTEGGDFDLGQGRAIAMTFEDFIAFSPTEGNETEQTLRRGLPTRSPEAAAALHTGRRLRQARLLLAFGELQWQFTLDGSTMALRSIKLPDDDPEADGPEERSRERAANFLLLHDFVGDVYKQFLLLRLTPEYLKGPGERQAQWMWDYRDSFEASG